MSPRPLVNRRVADRNLKDERDDIMTFLKAKIVQSGIRPDEKHKNWEEQRRERKRQPIDRDKKRWEYSSH